MMDFQTIRKEYEDQGIELDALGDCPIEQLKSWLEHATETSPGPWFESNVMALATAGTDGSVAVRYVLLKGIDDKGVRFFTNYESAKAKQLAINPNCSLAFHWPHLGRQLRITGTATKTSRQVSEDYFHSRPRGSQIGAAVSKQSEQLADRDELTKRAAALEAELSGAEVPLPEFWGGYLVKPNEFEFWQGRTNRLHDRIVYRLNAGTWVKSRLAP